MLRYHLGLSGPEAAAALDISHDDATISVRDVTFADGTLMVDFDFPATGVGNYSTSAGSMLWHNLIAANLLQLDGVEQLELLAKGRARTTREPSRPAATPSSSAPASPGAGDEARSICHRDRSSPAPRARAAVVQMP